MMKATTTILLFGILSCQSLDSQDNSTLELDKVEPLAAKQILVESYLSKTSSIAELELKNFWTDCILPIIYSDEKKLKQIVHFPLAGDWGFMVQLNKPDTLWTEKDFYDNHEKLFYPELIDSLKTKTFKNVEVFNHTDGLTELLVGVEFETWIDGFKNESGIILRFRQINGKWKLYVFQGVG
jgi:hypothetical protein